MRATISFFLLVLAVSAQTTKKPAPSKPAPAPLQMSHDFRTAGRRAVAAIGDLGRECSTEVPICGDEIGLVLKAAKATNEAGIQQDNAVDKSALELLKNYRMPLPMPRWTDTDPHSTKTLL